MEQVFHEFLMIMGVGMVVLGFLVALFLIDPSAGTWFCNGHAWTIQSGCH